jgi:3-methyladenine DNA glycosylase AlkD
MIELVSDLQVRLEKKAQAAKRRWWEQYLKGQAAFRGVPMADVRTCVHAWSADYALSSSLRGEDLLKLAGRLVAQDYSEDKLAGTILVQEILVPEGRLDWRLALPDIERWFDDGHLADWNVVDWFSVKALWALVESAGGECGQLVLNWSGTSNLWRARAALVTYANVSSRGNGVFPGFPEALIEACRPLIGREERFAKTAVGWVLRGLREPAPALVDAFVTLHLAHFSIEALRSAMKHAGPTKTRELLEMRQTLTSD